MELKYNFKKLFGEDYVNVLWEETWHSIKVENIRLDLGLDKNEKITEDIIKKFMEEYYS